MAIGVTGFLAGRLWPLDGGDTDTTSVPDNPEAIETIDSFIERYTDIAHEVEKKYGVPYETVLAMAVLESGGGQSELAIQANNFHGMKANDEWPGESYEKITKEFQNGQWVEVLAKFKHFDSPEAGFMGFGDHLRTRFGGTAYADAFVHKDPYKFTRALMDGTGARYATDPEYYSKIVPILNRITGKQEEFLPSSVLEMRRWKDLSKAEQRQFGSATEYDISANKLMTVDTDPKRYDEFIKKIQDLTDYTANELNKAGLVGQPFPDRKLSVDNPRIVLHHTGWKEPAWGHDGKKFVSSIINNKLNNGIVGSANQFLGRDDGILYEIAPTNQVAAHAGFRRNDGFSYNNNTIGIETPAEKQSDVTPEQYENLVYAIARHWRDIYGDGVRPNQSDMRKFVIGHGEISELHPEVSSHSDFPRAIADALADLTYNFLQTL